MRQLSDTGRYGRTTVTKARTEVLRVLKLDTQPRQLHRESTDSIPPISLHLFPLRSNYHHQRLTDSRGCDCKSEVPGPNVQHSNGRRPLHPTFLPTPPGTQYRLVAKLSSWKRRRCSTRRPSLRGSLHNRSEVPRDADWDTTYLKRIRLHGNLLILGGELVTSLGGISGCRSIIITVAENYHVSQSLWVCIVPGIRNAE